jgi:hypothetical protein
MSDKNSAGGSGVGLGGLLFIVFLVLKLCGVIDWSWWWVFAPLWVPSAVVALLLIAGVVLFGVAGLCEYYREKWYGNR